MRHDFDPMMQIRPIVLVAGLALLVGSIAASPTTAPTSRPVASLLSGVYRGTVVDDEQLVPCVTTFAIKDGKLLGAYVVREGKEQYPGTLDRYELVSEERRECRFHWQDKHGDGIVTMTISADGQTFAGTWGLEFIEDRLVWRGERQASSPHQPNRP